MQIAWVQDLQLPIPHLESFILSPHILVVILNGSTFAILPRYVIRMGFLVASQIIYLIHKLCFLFDSHPELGLEPNILTLVEISLL